MRYFLPALIAGLIFPLIAAAQSKSMSVCSGTDGIPPGVVLNICTHERGMSPLPQPRLFLRLYDDGRAEYERNPIVTEGDPRGYEMLVMRTARVTIADLQEIVRLGRKSDFQNAAEAYSAVHLGDDSTTETTVIFRSGEAAVKKMVLINYSPGSYDNYLHYPASFNYLMDRAEEIWERMMGIVNPLPTINFCDLVKNHEKYAGRRLGVYANLEYGGFVPYLTDLDCSPVYNGSYPATTRITVNYVGIEAERIRAAVEKIPRKPFYGRARVVVYGSLRVDKFTESFVDQIHFDITGFKSIEPVKVPYDGSLEPGWLYAHTLFKAGPGEVLQLVPPIKAPLHHAVRVEWTNLARFLPALRRKGVKGITFHVISRNVRKIDTNRWNTLYICEIVEVT